MEITPHGFVQGFMWVYGLMLFIVIAYMMIRDLWRMCIEAKWK